jgi:hypothetical protein
MNYIYGSIGYTVLQFNNKKIIILSDMHDLLKPCNKNEIIISKWLEKKIIKKKSKILLEEVPINHDNLKILWQNSIHTNELKKLYIKYKDLITGIDIRVLLIPFSLELINEINTDITLYEYLKLINDFFSLLFIELKKFNYYKLENLKKSLIGKHFIIIKNNYKIFIKKYNKILNEKIKIIVDNDLLNNLNNILNDIIEWYTCACIFEFENNSIIIHIGLYHAEKIIDWLINIYNFKIINIYGINNILQTKNINEHNGCIMLTPIIDNEL